MSDLVIYDTTLRDGTQGEGIQVSVADKIAIARLLDELGVAYIEGGWPGSNPRDRAFFKQARKLELQSAKLTAFGSTRRSGVTCDQDNNLQELLRTELATLTIFGKTWAFQATHALRISPEENLDLIEDSIRYLKSRGAEVFFDAEHFFDGYAEDPEYAIQALRAAQSGGADYLVLCDTNGGTLPHRITEAVARVCKVVEKPVGIHPHNDSEVAVANALCAVSAGARMVQGTINGYGERCGNANLVSIIPALALKMGIECISPAKLSNLRHVAHTVDELANRTPLDTQPYVGRSAFAHKGGMHVNAVHKDSRTYEHIDPALVGNNRRVLVSDLSGKDNIYLKARELGIELDPHAKETGQILDRLKELEQDGYQFEAAEASFKLIVDEVMGKRPKYFNLRNLQVTVDLNGKRTGKVPQTEGDAVARIEVEVGGIVAKTATRGEGPVNAMDTGLRSLIDKFYPALKTVRLLDYKVRVLSSKQGTGSIVRVLLQSGDGSEVWETVGVSHNIIAASWQAMVDGLEYKLVKDGVDPHLPGPEMVVEADSDSPRPPSRVPRRRKRSKKRHDGTGQKENQQKQ
jgi:2-isopropylmalate synthase